MRVRSLPEILVCALALLALFVPIGLTYADELDDVTSQLSEEKQRLADLESKKNQLAKSISSASASLAQVSAQLTEAETELAEIAKLLAEKEELLAQWEADRNLLIRDLYKKSKISPIEVALSEDSFAGSARQFYYYEENLDVLAEQIGALNGEISVFQENKAQAEKIKNELASLKTQYQILLSSRRSAYSSTSSQLAQVKASIQGLTAKQEQLILAKFAASAGSETVGDTEPLSEPLPDPGFSPAYMVATYGYPHRVGMSQYGAYGRSKAGQLYPEILAAYYQNTSLSGSCDKNRRINVEGYGEILLEEEYLMGLGEVPSSWGLPSNKGMEALKAQVVAARSYALYYVQSGKPICTTASCQVFLGKGAKKGTPWEEAVNATCGQVLTYGGSTIAAYYHSTAGGYTLNSEEIGWNSRGWLKSLKDYDNLNRAYEGPNYGNSPWFHTGWGSRTGSGYNPWMTAEELADIFNARLLYEQSDTQNRCRIDDDNPPYTNTGLYTPCLSPTDKGGWSVDRVRSELNAIGISPATAPLVVDTYFDGRGAITTSVRVLSPSRDPLTLSEKDFRAMFNLRSCGTLMIPFISSPVSKFDIGVCSTSSDCASSIQFR